MKNFSVIIPTMWKSDYLLKMIEVYDNSEFIDEVIIIDNEPDKQTPITSDKVKIHTKGENIYVNPAWNMGVSLSKTPYIIIANDDIIIDGEEFKTLLELSLGHLKENTIIGPSMHCFKQKGLVKEGIKITKTDDNFNYGFGTFMIMKRTSYTIIPDDILIFHGDVIQHKTNDVYLFSGVEIDTPMSTTLHGNPEIHALAKLDHGKALKYDVKTLNKAI